MKVRVLPHPPFYRRQMIHKHKVNDKFFDKWSADMAYVLGYFFGDGCIYKNKGGSKRVIFCGHQDDEEFLKKLASIIGCSALVSQSKRSKCCRFEFVSARMFDRLYSLGKRKRLVCPKVPREFIRDFVRGYIDSDGCVGFVKSEYYKTLSSGYKKLYCYNKLVVQMTSKDIGFLCKLEKYIRGLGFKKANIHGNQYFSVYYYRLHAQRLVDLIYYKNCLALTRKLLQVRLIGRTVGFEPKNRGSSPRPVANAVSTNR